MAGMPDPAAVAQPPVPPPAGRARFWKRAFFVSLAVNLLVMGMIGGALLKGPPPGSRSVRDLGFGAFSGALSEADHKALRRDFFRKGGISPRALRQAVQEDQQAVLQALRADPFVAEALEAALARQNQRMQRQFETGQTVLRDHLAAMSVAERRAFADRLEDSLRRAEAPRDSRGGEGQRGEGQRGEGQRGEGQRGEGGGPHPGRHDGLPDRQPRD